MKIYLDHNVLVGIAGRPRWPDADAELTKLAALAHCGVQWVLSAIHIYELARSGDDRNVAECCKLVASSAPARFASSRGKAIKDLGKALWSNVLFSAVPSPGAELPCPF
jgi:hypothetical protein